MFMLNELLIKELSNKVDTNTSEIQSIKDAEVYSTSEVKTNKVWIDGKPIYKKVLVGGSVSGGSGIIISTNTNNIDTMLTTTGFGLNSGGSWWPLNRSHETTFNYQSGFYYNKTYNRFEVNSGTNAGYTKVYIIMEYTKTTD